MSVDEKNLQRLTRIKELLKNQSDIILNFKEACDYLDLRPSYLYKLTSSTIVPCYKPNGKKLYFSKAELDNWILSNSINPKTKINN